MKTFRELREASVAQDYVAPKDKDDEVDDIKSRAKGEQDFRDSHTVKKTDHPVADDKQHVASHVKHAKPKQPMNGERAPVKQGSSDVKNTHDGSKSRDTSKATASKGGETAVIKPIKEGDLKLGDGKVVNISAELAQKIHEFANDLDDSHQEQLMLHLTKDMTSFQMTSSWLNMEQGAA